jgi:hypothetical protein
MVDEKLEVIVTPARRARSCSLTGRTISSQAGAELPS